MKQGSFEINLDAKESHVTIGEGHSADNKVKITITNNGSETSVKVTVGVICGATKEALLSATTDEMTATYSLDGSSTNRTSSSSSGNSRSWQTSSAGVKIGQKETLSISLSRFDSNTPPGNACIDVLVQVRQGSLWSPRPEDVLPENRTLKVLKEVLKGAERPEKPTIHYFTVDPDYILHAGQTPVSISFYTTGFKIITLYRNNQEVQNWPSNEHPANADDSITGVFADKPSITSVYRLEVKSDSNAEKPEQTRYRTVQVISPGWNQLALPQGYPTQLCVIQGFSGSGVERLYGIFIDGNNKAALYSSATGVDDWRLEPGDVPQHMAMSPGVAYDNKLWLIGGSCVDANQPGSAVWCYEKEPTSEERKWNKKADFPDGMTRRMGHACVVVPRTKDDKPHEGIWVLGGYYNGANFNDVWTFSHEKWEEIKVDPPQWPARLMHAAVCFRPDPPARGESAPPPEVYIYGGAATPAPDKGLQDLWVMSDGKSWKQLTTREQRGIVPPPGPPLAAALVTAGGAAASGSEGPTTPARLFLGGTFLEDEHSNRIRSLIFELKRRTNVWQQSPVIDGWEQFEGGFFYMQAVAFNGFLFVWSLLSNISKSAPPKLNILIPR